VHRVDLAFEISTRDLNALNRRAKDMNLTLNQLVILALATGFQAVADINMLDKDALQVMADDQEDLDPG
jgi:hypothetical protein